MTNVSSDVVVLRANESLTNGFKGFSSTIRAKTGLAAISSGNSLDNISKVFIGVLGLLATYWRTILLRLLANSSNAAGEVFSLLAR